MKHNNRYFSNKECEYYPCHNIDEEFNCLFCYCPLYNHPNCEGNFKLIENENKKVKDCSNCTFPHIYKNYDKVINKLRDMHQ